MSVASDHRLKVVRQMIMVGMLGHRKVASGLLLPYQRFDFEGISHALDGLNVTNRLLDPALHEFRPKGDRCQHWCDPR
ncbi:hypothetical protein MKW98_031156 [Papaver atlanticum]|uniref:Uncharacterized protein n=1 Tax=Papaver atlanticum TaxID=357466 RepID=A0AAD4SV11_9MAGN|nr:hypothetical protein MKW98_031156 [Papaver atlanticum]